LYGKQVDENRVSENLLDAQEGADTVLTKAASSMPCAGQEAVNNYTYTWRRLGFRLQRDRAELEFPPTFGTRSGAGAR